MKHQRKKATSRSVKMFKERIDYGSGLFKVHEMIDSNIKKEYFQLYW